MALTDLGIRKLVKPKEGKRKERWDREIPGLAVRITDNGIRSFNFIYTFGTKVTRSGRVAPHRHRVTLGRVGELTLEEAREKARELRKLVRQGRHPAQEEKATRVTAAVPKLFPELVEIYTRRVLEDQRAGRPIRQLMDRHLKRWANLPVAAITRDLVLERVETLVDAGKRGMARRVFHATSRMLDWAISRGGFGIAINPCATLKVRDIIGRQVARDRVLNDRELRALIKAVRSLGHPYHQMVELLALTGLRRCEVAQARWREFDLATRMWTIPPERRKGNRVHLVPLTNRMLELLASIPREGEYLFPGKGGKVFNAFAWLKEKIDAAMLAELQTEDPAAKLEPFRIHDIRRTMRTGLSALPVPGGDLVRELIIGHARPQLHQVYDQHAYMDERRQGLELWGERLEAIVKNRKAYVADLAKQRAKRRKV
jgi:integrase